MGDLVDRTIDLEVVLGVHEDIRRQRWTYVVVVNKVENPNKTG